MATPNQSWWQELQDPGVNPKLDTMIQLLHQIADNLAVTRVTQPGTSRASSGQPTSPSSRLMEVLPSGTVFTLPETLQRFNELVGAAAIAGATPVEVTADIRINPGTTGEFVYQVPEGMVSIAMSASRGFFSRHSPDIVINGFLNYGLPDMQPITLPNIPATHDFVINRLVDGSHEILDNLTILFTNDTPWVISVTVQTVVLEIDQALWEHMYYPIFR